MRHSAASGRGLLHRFYAHRALATPASLLC